MNIEELNYGDKADQSKSPKTDHANDQSIEVLPDHLKKPPVAYNRDITRPQLNEVKNCEMKRRVFHFLNRLQPQETTLSRISELIKASKEFTRNLLEKIEIEQGMNIVYHTDRYHTYIWVEEEI